MYLLLETETELVRKWKLKEAQKPWVDVEKLQSCKTDKIPIIVTCLKLSTHLAHADNYYSLKRTICQLAHLPAHTGILLEFLCVSHEKLHDEELEDFNSEILFHNVLNTKMPKQQIWLQSNLQ